MRRVRNPRLASLLCALVWGLLAAAPAIASVKGEVAFHRGVAAFGEGRFFDAEREFEVVLEEDPEDTAALTYLGLIARGQGELDDAIARFEKVLELDPADVDARMELAVVLLEAKRNARADVQLGTVRARRPGDAYVLHYSGVAAYRLGRYAEAVRYFRRAGERDPDLRIQSEYYIGLSETLLRNNEGAIGAFGVVADESPSHPLARSARELRRAMTGPEPQRFTAYLTAGAEFDSNPLGLADIQRGQTNQGVSDDGDVRGVVAYGGEVRLVEEPLLWTAGFDSFMSFHADQTRVDQQTHMMNTALSMPFGIFRAGIRGDISWSGIRADSRTGQTDDLYNTFLWLYRVVPTLSVRTGDWGVNQIYYEYQYNDYKVPGSLGNGAFERDGSRHTIGFDQFAFFEGFLRDLRFGAAFTDLTTDGPEFDHIGVEVSAGGTVGMGIVSLSALYRFGFLTFEGDSALSGAANPTQREDFSHRVELDLITELTEWAELAIYGRLVFNDSDVNFYEYDRQIGGATVTFRY